MNALDRFIAWLQSYAFVDRNNRLPVGLRLQYHSRSDEHSKKLGELIVDDLLDHCPVLREQATRGEVAYGINHVFVWPNGKAKTLDLAIGIPHESRLPPPGTRIRRLRSQSRARQTPQESLGRVLIACEEKAVMTEHGKSQPRIYSELNDSHVIVHGGSRDTIAAGIAMVNIARTFVSPLRQNRAMALTDLVITAHDQPAVTANMIAHLRRLPLRTTIDASGLDAYCTFVVEVDNQERVALYTAPPAPQPGDPDDYGTFLQRISQFYTERYGDLQRLPDASALTVEEALVTLARSHPGLLTATGDLAIAHDLEGAADLDAILESLEHQANPAAAPEE